MKIAVLIVRLVLGLVFLVFGLNAFLQFLKGTSTGARQATTALRPHASASSRSAASSTQNPPMFSLVSGYGPAVMSTLPPGCARSDLALLPRRSRQRISWHRQQSSRD
jgi:hypothetical protein